MITDKHYRTEGATTRQMLGAPQKAVYVWHRDNEKYPKALAKHLKRDDLEIVGPNWLADRRWAGRRFSGIVVDHHASALLTAEQWEIVDMLRILRVFVEEDTKAVS